MPDLEKVIKGLECHADRTNLSCRPSKCPYFAYDFCGPLLATDAIGLLKERPVAKCHWVKMTGMMPPEYHGHYGCSNCGWHGIYSEKERDYKFCPACGADMRGDDV